MSSTIYITVANSQHFSSPMGYLLDLTSPDGEFIVDADAYIINDTGGGTSLVGSWNGTINGEVAGFGVVPYAGIHIEANDSISELSTFKVGKTGFVSGWSSGIEVNASIDLTNFGRIAGIASLRVNGSARIANAGILAGDVQFGIFNDVFANYK